VRHPHAAAKPGAGSAWRPRTAASKAPAWAWIRPHWASRPICASRLPKKILKGMLIVAEVEFTLTHDLERLTALAEPHYPDVPSLFDEVRSLTPWNTAYRYPGPDPVPEPLPSASKINQVLETIERLAARLRLQLGN
jgi:hypothetical protein